MKRLLVIISLFLWVTSVAQTGSLSGKIQNAKGESLPGFSIVLEGTKYGATTDNEGNFLIQNVKGGSYTIVATGLGYTAKRSNVQIDDTKNATLNLQLDESNRTLNEVVVQAKNNRYTSTIPSLSLRLNTPLIETPQNIIVLNSGLLKDRNVVSISEVARFVSGVSRGPVLPEISAGFQMRGTNSYTNQFKNGVGGFEFGIVDDAALIDKVEFIKGPAGFILSSGEPGGIFNITTKQPTRTKIRSATLGIGSFNEYRATIDLGGAVTHASKLSYRFNAAATLRDGYQDFSSTNKYVIAPVLRYDIGKKTYVTAEYNLHYTWLKTYSAGLRSKPEDINRYPTNFSLGDSNTPGYESRVHYGRFAVVHSFSPAWRLTAQIGWDKQYRGGYDVGTASRASNDTMYQALYGTFDDRDHVTEQVFLSGHFTTGKAVEHTVLIGYDGALLKGNNLFLYGPRSDERPVKASNPTYGYDVSGAISRLIGDPEATRIRWNTAYVQDHIKLYNKVIVTLAGRFSHAESTTNADIIKDDVFTPRLGLTYLFTKNISAYALYDQAYQAQAGLDFFGNRFEPLRGSNKEVGLKAQLMKGRLYTGVSVYNIKKTNSLSDDPVNSTSGQLFREASGEIVAKGVEIDVIGNINENFSITANYAYTETEINKDTRSERIGLKTNAVPRNNYNVWAGYHFTKSGLKGVGIGFGVSSVGGRNIKEFIGVPNSDYTLCEANLSYRRGKYGLNLLVNNLLNDRYLVSGFRTVAPQATYSYTPGLPRSFRLILSADF